MTTRDDEVTVEVVIVHHRSGGMLADLVADLGRQRGVRPAVHVVECGDDGSVASVATDVAIRHLSPGTNLGYSGGNNLVLGHLIDRDPPVLVVNPDVRLPDVDTLRRLHDALVDAPSLAAVAPTIRSGEKIEYTGSLLDLRRALAVHTGTHRDAWPPGAPEVVVMPWIDGACWMLRPSALRQVGLFDERLFLFFEEADWCLRATESGWSVGVLRDVEVGHTRSSSFGTSPKGAYYYWRNLFLVSRAHGGLGRWVGRWFQGLLRFTTRPANIRSGQSRAALRGGLDGVRLVGGPGPIDRG